MKYLKYLQTTNDFESFKNSEDYVLPNVSYIVETEGVSYEPAPPPPPRGILPGDIVFYNDGVIDVIDKDM